MAALKEERAAKANAKPKRTADAKAKGKGGNGKPVDAPHPAGGF